MDLIEEWIPNPYLQALALVVGSILVGALLDWLLGKLLKRWAQGTRSHFDDRLIALVHGPVVKTVVLCGVRMAYHRIDEDPARAAMVDRVIGSVILLIWTVFAFRATGLLLRSAADRPEIKVVEERTFPLFDNLSKTIVFAVALWCLISLWHIDAGPWIASAGVAGIALGFAAQDTLSNFFAGIFIIADAPYRVGDYVNLDNGQRGRVERIGIGSWVLRWMLLPSLLRQRGSSDV